MLLGCDVEGRTGDRNVLTMILVFHSATLEWSYASAAPIAVSQAYSI